MLRGIEEELSPELRDTVRPAAVLLLGVAFNLRNYHPDLLFAVFVPYTLDEVTEIVRQRPGKDWIEGKEILGVPVSRERAQQSGILSSTNWLPAGKASLLRTNEFLHGTKKQSKVSLTEIIGSLARGSNEFLCP